MSNTAVTSDQVSANTLGKFKKKINKSDLFWGYLFILPGIIGLSVFVIYPLVYSAYIALTKWDGVTDPKFIGFQNFQYMFTKDPVFWPSIKATVLYVVLSVPATLALGLLLAVLLNQHLPGIKIFRTILYLPTILPAVATLTLWKFIYQPNYGLANAVLSFFHLPTSKWLTGEDTALISIIIIGLWGVGGTMIVFLAGLQAVPKEVYEAARIDGANAVRLFWNVTIPMISPILFLQLITQMIGALQAFSQAQILTQGGPNNATNFLMYNIYAKGFGNLGSFPDLGYATAQVWILFFLIMAVTALTFRFSNFWVYNETSAD
ncbi:MAG: sugar ABC transporter permease [Chloroflexi bacterium]|nr:sugar ABC transporter permease [Chloroflexota bacterium]